MASLIGQQLGHYHILEQLGEGGMATVYKAYDTRLERNVAIKVILSIKDHSEKFIKRFEREARALAKLSHPNIVGVIDYGELDGIPYLVMEYLPGGTLKQKTGKPIPWQEAVHLLIPVARALSSAHKQGIIHRDVKPSNILLTDTGEPMLTDFGIAKIIDAGETMELTGTGVGIGTPEYMAPEQSQGKAIDERVDVYALGVVLYELVTGHKPYQADTPMAVIWKLASEPLPPPKQFVQDLPDEVEQILYKALAKKPENRYNDMDALLLALEKLIQSNIATSTKKNISWIRRKPGLTWIATVPVIVLISVLWFAITSENKSDSVLTSTATPTTTITISATNTKEPTNSPTPVTTIAPFVFDDFNNPAFDGSFSREKWEALGICGQVAQENGTLVFRDNNGCDLVVNYGNTRYFLVDQPTQLQAQVWMGNDFRGDIATQELQIISIDNKFMVLCGIYDDQLGPRFFFSIGNMGQPDSDYRQESPAQLDTWYKIRIEINPDTMQTSCYIDDWLLGSHTPSNADWLKTVNMRMVVEAARYPATFVTTAVDDVIISR